MPLQFVKNLTRSILPRALVKSRIRELVFPMQESSDGEDIKNIRVLHPAERITIASPDHDGFISIAKYYQEGWFDRPDIFVCEVPEANFHLESGLVCTRSFKAIADYGLEHRMVNYPPYLRRRPLLVKKLSGVYSSINYCFAGNFWHWMFDCLPKVHLLSRVAPTSGLTLLMPDSANEFQRETLRCVLPRHFKVDYISGNEWLRPELFLWPSLVSDRCMGLLPTEYYEAIRVPVFKEYNLSNQHIKKERLYISRQGAKHRRVLNEDALMQLLEKWGFHKVVLEDLPFREQVELFHRAEIIVGPHGAGLGTIFFSGNIDVVVLYPTRVPPNYFHSMALGLGQKHHFVCHDEVDEDSNFAADLPALERVLTDELGLQPES